MEWPLMSNQEVHAFGIEATLPYLAKEGVTVESVDHNPKKSPPVKAKQVVELETPDSNRLLSWSIV